jgi:DHA2 family multidrug resistance protein
MAYLHEGLTPFTQAYDTTLATMSRTIAAGGTAASAAQQRAFGHLFQDLINQAQILAYTDVFAVCAILSIIVVPFTLLLSPAKAAGAAGGH